MLLLGNFLFSLPYGSGAIKFFSEVAIGIVIEVVIGSLIILAITLLLFCKKTSVSCSLSPMAMSGLEFFGKFDREFELEQLLGSEAKVLGKGTFGCTYVAQLDTGDGFVVKRLKGSCDFEKEKVEELGSMLHENLLPLRAYHHSNNETLLICDYMPRGSLSDLLHWKGGENQASLNWQVRRRIAYGVARGIEYIHSQGQNVCHGNIRSSNVLLTNSFDARVSDFGLAQLLSTDSKLKCIVGYRAPELTNAYKVSQKSDVYSFGVLLLELLTSKAPVSAVSNKKGENLPKWVRLMFQEKPIIDVFDQKLLKNQNIEEQMFLILQLAICCTFEYPNNRPSIGVVVNRIREICYSD